MYFIYIYIAYCYNLKLHKHSDWFVFFILHISNVSYVIVVHKDINL